MADKVENASLTQILGRALANIQLLVRRERAESWHRGISVPLSQTLQGQS